MGLPEDFRETFSFENLPEDVVDTAKKTLLDFFAAGFAGCEGKAATLSWPFARDCLGGSPCASAFGREEALSLTGASFFNSLCASDLDIDDGTRVASGHQGGVLYPPLLALAESSGTSGSEVIEAAVVGYEMGTRAGGILNSGNRCMFFGSGAWAAVGAAASCAWLLGLDHESFSHALGIAEAHAPISPVMKSIRDGAMVKESMPWAAVTGMTSAYLAQKGFEGVRSILFEEGVLDDLGDDYYINRTYFKKYSCCRWVHPALDALHELRSEHSFSHGEVSKIRVRTHEKGATLQKAEVRSLYEAQYSMPFAIALALKRGCNAVQAITAEDFEDPDVREAARNVEIVFDPQIDAAFPERNMASLSVHLDDGRLLETGPCQARGDLERPFEMGELVAKFQCLAASRLPEQERDALLEKILRLEKVNARDLWRHEGKR
jgi:2-methylcitrate dehydratase PrpD